MSPENFCYWLRGYIELNSEDNPGLTPDQLKKVSEHLSLVLREVPKNPEGYEEYKGFGTVYLTDPPSSIYIRDEKNRNFRVHEDQNPVEINPGEGLKPVDFPLQIDPNIKCFLTC